MAEEKSLRLQTDNIGDLPPHSDLFPASAPVTVGEKSALHQSPHPQLSFSSKTMVAGQGVKENSLQKKSKPTQRRESSRRSSTLPIPDMEITYTPTTHRISKAKKGKKVHACEFPGCNKIFTRAEHRKRHEANHNTSPAFQCQIEGCKKPFQRADLLTRHMERQHNIPVDPSTKSQYSRSTHSASPSLGNIGAPHLGRHSLSSTSPMPPSSGTMAIGTIVEQNHYSNDYRSHAMANGLQEFSPQAPIGTAPRSLHPDLLYGLASSGDSPLYASSDSCYSPVSDYLQPHQPMAPYFGHEISRPQTVAAESAFQAMVNSPMTHSPVSVGPPTPAWGPTLDPLNVGPVSDAPCFSMPSQFQYSSPPWTNATTIPHYDVAVSTPQAWHMTKVSF